MPESVKVRFTLFGGLRGFRNGREFELPRKTAGIYLRLFLLSGDLFLDNAQGRRLGTSSSIRTLLVKANKPSVAGQWSREDFHARSGLELKYREGAGICLVGGEWSSDVLEFEAIWKRRTTASVAELEAAVRLSDPGISLGEWPPHRVLADCWNWADERVQAILEAREDIFAELKRRQTTGAGGEADDNLEGAAGGLKQEGTIPVETSGLQNSPGEPGSRAESSTSPGGPLRGANDEPSTVTGELLGDGSPTVPEARRMPGTALPWLIEWIETNSITWMNLERFQELRSKYATTFEDIETILVYATGYAMAMINADRSRANRLFPRSLANRWHRARRSSVSRYEPDKLQEMAFADTRKDDSWNSLIRLEQIRREHSNEEDGLTETQRRLYRACFYRCCDGVQKRFKEVTRGVRTSDAEIQKYEAQVDVLFTYLLALVHLQEFGVIEAHTREQRRGGLDPLCLPPIEGESPAARRARADKQVWYVDALKDLIAVPDWNQPLAPDLSAAHRLWLEEIQTNLDQRKAERATKQAARRADFKPIADRGLRGWIWVIVPSSLVSGWVTFVGIGSLGTFIFVNLEWAKVQGNSFASYIVPSMMISAILGMPVWMAMSYGFFVRYSQAVHDRSIRSAFGFLTVSLIVAVFSLLVLAILRL